MATKSNPANSAPTAPVAAADDPTHPFFGQGGSYFYDPATGQTTLRERSGQAGEQTPAARVHPSNPVSE